MYVYYNDAWSNTRKKWHLYVSWLVNSMCTLQFAFQGTCEAFCDPHSSSPVEVVVAPPKLLRQVPKTILVGIPVLCKIEDVESPPLQHRPAATSRLLVTVSVGTHTGVTSPVASLHARVVLLSLTYMLMEMYDIHFIIFKSFVLWYCFCTSYGRSTRCVLILLTYSVHYGLCQADRRLSFKNLYIIQFKCKYWGIYKLINK